MMNQEKKFFFNHDRFKLNGFLNHKSVLKIFKRTSISVVCSRWNEPFGRTSLEASSNGCATIISNRGGLIETTSDALILRDLESDSLYKLIKLLIVDKKLRNHLQKNSLKNFYLTNTYISKKIDKIRAHLFKTTKNIKQRLKILHPCL